MLTEKVSYQIVDNAEDMEKVGTGRGRDDLSTFVLLQITNFNVMSGEEARLFPSTGFTLSLHAGERVTLEGTK